MKNHYWDGADDTCQSQTERSLPSSGSGRQFAAQKLHEGEGLQFWDCQRLDHRYSGFKGWPRSPVAGRRP